ncbi:MAG: hypothetical protein C3F06_01130 [Candidatus Methanoperedenaceae archaeon]|nr:MAG: hypothetical protein C3F06_01130 [Candidatus Methanoperedenaceae archaeon]
MEKSTPKTIKIEEFLQELTPCIQRGELEACADEAERLARGGGIDVETLLDLSSQAEMVGRHDVAYLVALAAVRGLEDEKKARAHFIAGTGAQSIGKKKEAEEQYRLAIETNPKIARAHSSYANLLRELNREEEAEEQYRLAIETNPKYAVAHSNYAILLGELNRNEEAEEHYRLAIEANPKLAEAYFNYASLLGVLNRKEEAEEQYKLAIEANPKLAEAHCNYASLLGEQNRKEEAEEQYRLALEANPKYAVAHFNYASLLNELNRKEDAEEHYRLAIEANPKYAEAHSNYANLLRELNRKEEAEEQYRLAIEANPKLAEPHCGYGLLLINFVRREDAWKEIELASNLFQKMGLITESHLSKAWFYENYSQKNLASKKYQESSEDAYNAGEKYLKAGETIEGNIRNAFELRGNELKAKSFVRRRYKNFPELIENLKNATNYYQKASICPANEKQEICASCYSVMNVFSQVLTALEDIVNNKNPPINRNEWISVLKSPQEVYLKKELKKGIDLVVTINQLIKCVDELADYKVRKSSVQEKRLRDCYDNLIEVSSKVEGGLKNITDPASDEIRKYAKKKGFPIFDENVTSNTPILFNNWFIKGVKTVAFTIILGYIINWLFDLKAHVLIWNYINSTFFNQRLP